MIINQSATYTQEEIERVFKQLNLETEEKRVAFLASVLGTREEEPVYYRVEISSQSSLIDSE